jgi:hypothetical protein
MDPDDRVPQERKGDHPGARFPDVERREGVALIPSPPTRLPEGEGS